MTSGYCPIIVSALSLSPLSLSLSLSLSLLSSPLHLYQLLAGGDDKLLKQLQLEKDPSKYRYLVGSSPTASSLASSDEKLFEDVSRAMTVSVCVCSYANYCVSLLAIVDTTEITLVSLATKFAIYNAD